MNIGKIKPNEYLIQYQNKSHSELQSKAERDQVKLKSCTETRVSGKN